MKMGPYSASEFWPLLPPPPPLYATCIHELKMYVFRRFYLVGKPGPKDVEVNPSC